MGLYSQYPNQIDTTTQLPLSTDNVSPVKAEVVNRLQDAVLAIENELGVLPSSVFGTVRARSDNFDTRLTSLENSGGGGGGGGTGVLAGDVTGLSNANTVTKITGSAGVVSVTAAIQGSSSGAGTPLHYSVSTISLLASTYTLSASDMANSIIEFTGALSSNGSIMCPTVNGANFIINNKTTGGFYLTAHRADGYDAGIIIYNGQTGNIYYDGVLDNAYKSTITNGILPVQQGGSSIKSLYIYGFAGINQTNSTTFVNGATFEFDPTTLNATNGSRTIKLRVVAETTAPLMTIQLFNFTTTSVVAGSTLTTTSGSPAILVTGDLTSVLASGLNIYQVQIKMAAGGTTDRITLDAAKLQIDWS